MQELILFTGNIGCGKSFLARKFARRGHVIVSNDEIIKTISCDGVYDRAKSSVYHAAENAIVEEGLKGGFSVVIDRTGMNVKTRKRFIRFGKKYKINLVSYNWGPGSPNELARRISAPMHSTDETWKSVFHHMYSLYEEPIKEEGFDRILIPPKKYRFYAVDFDGVVVKNEFPKIGEINKDYLSWANSIYQSIENVIIMWTCRSGLHLRQMEEFLYKQKVPFDYINENPIFDTGSRKIFGHKYVDDRCVSPVFSP